MSLHNIIAALFITGVITFLVLYCGFCSSRLNDCCINTLFCLALSWHCYYYLCFLEKQSCNDDVQILTFWERYTSNEGVPREVLRTVANWIVIGHFAEGICTTNTRARVNALLAHASLIQVAVRVENAFRTTIRGHPEVARQTDAFVVPRVLHTALRVGPTRGRITRIRGRLRGD